MAFQALAIIGAGGASAAGNCTYNPATDTINVTITGGSTSTLQVNDGTINAGEPTGAILFDGSACGSATNDNTVAIVVLGQPGTTEQLVIDNFTGLAFNTAIAWAIDLGTGADNLFLLGTDGDDTITSTDDSFAINGGGGELNGVELQWLEGFDGNDVLDASALTSAVQSILVGDAGDDWLAPGAFDGDTAIGGADTDTLSYGGRTTCTVVQNNNQAGQDVDCNGDLAGATDENDAIDAFEIIETGTGNDTLSGVGGLNETFIPGDGDDDITGNAGDNDVVDYSTSSAAVTIDPAAGTVTGQGNDTITDITDFVGSPFDDVLIWDGTTNSFSGGDGWDTVDASADTGPGVSIDLDALDGSGPRDDLEQAIGGTGNDELLGNDLRNILTGNDGDDTLRGLAGNDRLVGGEGNDTYDGGNGADAVSFGGATQGVTVDMSLGFASGQGDDSFDDFVEIVSGSKFGDNITGGQLGSGGSINFRVRGRAGNDLITGSTSNDTLLGGAGNDVIRAGNGDDILKGGKGRDRGFGGGGDDVCRGVEREKGCEA